MDRITLQKALSWSRALTAGALAATLWFGGTSALADDAPYDEPMPAPKTEPAQPVPDEKAVPEDRASPDEKDAAREKKGAASTEARESATEDRIRSDDAWMRFESDDLRFEQSQFANEARVLVRSEDGAWRVHRGRDLESILSANADLAARPEIADLRSRVRTVTEQVAVRAERAEPAQFSGQVRTFVEAPGLLLERRGADETWLFVDDSSGGERAFVAKNLDAIVKDHPDLERIAGFPTLRARLREIDAKRALALRPDAMAIVDVRHSGDQVLVTAHAWRDGRWTAQTFRGNSIEEITAREMELRRILDLPAASVPSAAAPSPMPVGSPVHGAPPATGHPCPHAGAQNP